MHRAPKGEVHDIVESTDWGLPDMKHHSDETKVAVFFSNPGYIQCLLIITVQKAWSIVGTCI